MKHSLFRFFLIPLLISILTLSIIYAGALHYLDRQAQDALYQGQGHASNDIIIIGIDNQTLAELGTYGPGYRTYIAYALEKIASDPDHLPAVVAVDILYEGQTDPAADEQLARAAEKLGTVVTACMAEYGSEITWENGHAVSLDASAVISFVDPYESLKSVTTQGHINAMADKVDGVLRHAMLYVTKPGGEKVYSMAAQTAKIYMERIGKDFTLPDVDAAGHYYVPFAGQPGAFDDGYSLLNLLMGQITSDVWANKVVLIGPYAPAMQDAYITSANRGVPMNGVEYQANVIQSLLQKNLKTEAPDLIQFIAMALFCVGVTFLFFRLNTRISGIICISIIVMSLIGSWGFWLGGWVVHVLWLPVAIVMLYLASVIAHYVRTSMERHALELEKERVTTELSLATRIQSSFLPKVFPPFPDRHEFDLYASMTPAREVGGDLYDFFLIDEDHLCMVIGDVSGKGVPASLFMMLSSALIHHVAMHELSPAKILTSVNEEICSRNPEEMFVTVWLGVLEISTGILTAASAGHEFPAMKKPDGSFELIRDKHGFVLGGMEGVRYRDYTLQLEPGSRFFVYTDGVPEATDANKNMYGTERMLEALRQKQDSTPQEILSAVSQSVKDFVGPTEQFDDLTMLCLEYNGPQQS
ncbi:SpoIIE family protein phosphatase [Aristaeella lactis]|uniref:Serine phosphatase RsbU, regulator of sigma subunit n=1 Tax=Aristaeella lactis TaxID=3046383 RepID=A0AC61PJC0_9FIRM|nr:SpoIIE family protein phosphatase [Aristaeella lactis]QUA54012.1 SpoIIE family protein phosphatase [Aristaeella lactis]SMC42313.1 Serine phosphatase RsbU, regulator of sigma subunit [Aristaeella lactis]